MKHSFLVAGAAVSVLAPLSSSHAEERVLEITGMVEELVVPYEIPAQGELTFTALITEETEVSLMDEDDIAFGEYGYYDAVEQVSIEVVDNNEQLVFSDTFVFPPTPIDDEEYGPSEGVISLFMPDAAASFWVQPNAIWYGAKRNDIQENTSFRIVGLGVSPVLGIINDGELYMPDINYDQNYPLFASLEPFPTLNEGPLIYPFIYAVSDELSANEEPDFSIGVYGIATNLRYIDVDADGDGVVDSEDACAISLLDEQVTLKGQLLTVENVVDGNGCSVMDHYAACETEQGEGGFLAYNGASYCEQQVAYQLYREGLIDYADVRELRTALR